MERHSFKGPLALLLAAAIALTAPVSAWAETGEDEDIIDSDTSVVILDGEDDDSDPAEWTKVEATPAVAGASPGVSVLNAASLSPQSPGSQALDAYLDRVMDGIIDDNMDTYEQIKACYDYLVANVSYGSHMSRLDTAVSDGVTCRSIYNTYGEIEGFGAVALTAQQGMCNAYNSAFILMARKVGLSASLVEGYTRSSGGSYVYHKWTEVKIDGVTYVFDPQLEQNLVASGLPRYSVFCKTYDQVGNRYSK